jgi:hypothetical protein
MSSPGHGASQQAVVEAALVLLERMGLSPADLVAAPANQPRVPAFAEYVPVVSAAVSAGTRRAYGSYWNRIVEHWGDRHLDEPTPSDIRQLMTWVKTQVVGRRNARGGRHLTGHAAIPLLLVASPSTPAGAALPRVLSPGARSPSHLTLGGCSDEPVRSRRRHGSHPLMGDPTTRAHEVSSKRRGRDRDGQG